MGEGGSKYMIIKIETSTGEVVEVTNEEGEKPTMVDQEKMEEIHKSPDGFKYVGSILHAHSSPGCVYYFWRGVWWVFC